MRILLDTHVLIWALTDPKRLSPRAADLVLDLDTRLIVSSVSVWELGIKYHTGKIPEIGRILSRLEHSLALLGAEELSINHKHALKAAELPMMHLDPFDRMLIAQAIVEGVPIISKDQSFQHYPVLTIW